MQTAGRQWLLQGPKQRWPRDKVGSSHRGGTEAGGRDILLVWGTEVWPGGSNANRLGRGRRLQLWANELTVYQISTSWQASVREDSGVGWSLSYLFNQKMG